MFLESAYISNKHKDGRLTVVPVHSGEEIGTGLLNKIIRTWIVKRGIHEGSRKHKTVPNFVSFYFNLLLIIFAACFAARAEVSMLATADSMELRYIKLSSNRVGGSFSIGVNVG